MRTPCLDLLHVLDRAYDRRSWHGPNLRGAIRTVKPEQSVRRPAPGRHSISEIVVHAAYWKYVVRRRLLGEPKGSFPLPGSDWFARGEDHGNRASWNADVALLDDMHQRLRAAVETVDKHGRAPRLGSSEFTPIELILGVAAHDLYHAGQIQLVKRLIG
jgi:hypothetical protein